MVMLEPSTHQRRLQYGKLRRNVDLPEFLSL
jgi:hypothetical protein